MRHSNCRYVILACCLTMLIARPAGAQVRMNQIQVIGTHNSYHLEPHPAVMKLIEQNSPAQAAAISYSHRPLTEQLEVLGIRKVELDVYADPEGGHYARPMAIKMIET